MHAQETLIALVVEDNMGDFLLIKDYLFEQFNTPELLHAKKFSEAKNIIYENTKALDVILLDLTLPDKNGESLITEMVELAPDTPVIVLTGYGDLEFGIKSLSLKASDYLLKDDINASSLFKSIKYNIERKKTNLMLEESEKRYSNLFQLSPQPMWIVEIVNYSFIQVNEAALDQYGYTEAEFLQLDIADLVVENLSKEEKMLRIKEVANNKETFKGRYKHFRKSGDIIEVDIYSNRIKINDTFYDSIIAVDVTEKVRMEQAITKAIIKTQEDERYEMGTELHDNVCQILASSQLSLEMLKDKIPGESMQWLEKSKQFINTALEEIRNISHRLAPAFFGSSSLEESFQDLIKDMNLDKTQKVNMLIHFNHDQEGLHQDLQLTLYRILQEQLRNIVKYAQSDRIEIELHTDQEQLIFHITDNGVGFDPENVKKGIGFANIKRRAELLNGTMDVISSPGNGCSVHVMIPMH
jgi:PAS domain S-box-containing protein